MHIDLTMKQRSHEPTAHANNDNYETNINKLKSHKQSYKSRTAHREIQVPSGTKDQMVLMQIIKLIRNIF
jgi:hypothetical protein